MLSPRLTGRQVVACLAHGEQGHEHFGHSCSSPTNEQRAWEYAAALVIAPTEYAVAEARVGPDPAGLAMRKPPSRPGWSRPGAGGGTSVGHTATVA